MASPNACQYGATNAAATIEMAGLVFVCTNMRGHAMPADYLKLHAISASGLCYLQTSQKQDAPVEQTCHAGCGEHEQQ